MNFDKEIRNILKIAGVKLSESKASEDWEKEFAERNGIPDGYDETDDEFFEPKLVHNDEEYQSYLHPAAHCKMLSPVL